jgi:hypothetical protein
VDQEENNWYVLKIISVVCKVTHYDTRTIVKVFKSPGWEHKFNDFAETFQQHKVGIHADLDLQISAGVSSANEAIARVEAKVNLIVFSLLRSNAERDLVTFMNGRRPESYLQDDAELQSLIRFSEQKAIERKKDRDTRVADPNTKERERDDGFELKLMVDIKREMYSSIDAMLQENMKVFSVKFDLQQKQIVAEVSIVVQRTGDRLQTALLSGPHDRILDEVRLDNPSSLFNWR